MLQITLRKALIHADHIPSFHLAHLPLSDMPSPYIIPTFHTHIS